MIDFQNNLFKAESNLAEALTESGIREAGGVIKTSDEISGIEIRLSHVIIKNNKTPKIFPFPGFANIYFMNIVISDQGLEPISLKLNGFEKIDDGDHLSVDRTLFFWKKNETNIPPSQVHIMSSIIKGKQNMRKVGEILAKVNEDAGFKNLQTTVAKLIKDAANFNVVSDVVFQVAGIVGKFLKEVEDKPLLTWVQSFTDIAGDWDPRGQTDKKAENRSASMQLNLFIRDAARQLQVDNLGEN